MEEYFREKDDRFNSSNDERIRVTSERLKHHRHIYLKLKLILYQCKVFTVTFLTSLVIKTINFSVFNNHYNVKCDRHITRWPNIHVIILMSDHSG